jgi:hypothetical protein
MFDLKEKTKSIEITATKIINTLFLNFTEGIKSMNKLIGIIILEYNSSLVANVRGINKNPKGNKYLKANSNTITAFCKLLPIKKTKEIKENVTALKKIYL